MDFSDPSWKDFPDTGRSTGAYIILYQGGTIDHGTHVPIQVDKLSAESKYNSECTAAMALSNFRVLIHEQFNKDKYLVPEETLQVILDSKYAVCMANNGKNTKNTRNITREAHPVRNGEELKIHKINQCEGVFNWQTLQLRMQGRMV